MKLIRETVVFVVLLAAILYFEVGMSFKVILYPVIVGSIYYLLNFRK